MRGHEEGYTIQDAYVRASESGINPVWANICNANGGVVSYFISTSWRCWLGKPSVVWAVCVVVEEKYQTACWKSGGFFF